MAGVFVILPSGPPKKNMALILDTSHTPTSDSIRSETVRLESLSLLGVIGYLDQVKLGLVTNRADQKQPFGKYRALYTRVRGVVGSVMIHHTCLLSKAWLKVLTSLKPNPPAFLGLQSLAQLA
ncbi:hypothetical protein LIER_05058 [Lithospermum erythrorhizon]|uniref:Uncharacterized protein n=1 Tax=Lithospermum erythrorhizon TaxID=34254 RepID=A0AAV3P3S7_LITER